MIILGVEDIIIWSYCDFLIITGLQTKSPEHPYPAGRYPYYPRIMENLVFSSVQVLNVDIYFPQVHNLGNDIQKWVSLKGRLSKCPQKTFVHFFQTTNGEKIESLLMNHVLS